LAHTKNIAPCVLAFAPLRYPSQLQIPSSVHDLYFYTVIWHIYSTVVDGRSCSLYTVVRSVTF